MSLKRLTQPASEPVTLAELRELLSMQAGYTANDDVITTRITEARQWAEEYTARTFVSSNWQLKLDAFPTEFRLRNAPVSAVVSLAYVDTAGATQTLAGTDYLLDNADDNEAWVLPAYGTEWPETLDVANAVTLTYTAGWANAAAVPAPIKEAIRIMVVQLMQFQSQQASGYAPDIPRAALSRLSPYRVLEF